jgi:VanZ family protein
MADHSHGLVRFWLPVVLWLGWMFFASTDVMSSEHTSRFIGPFLRWWKPDITLAAVESIQLVVRKCAHAVDYAILSMLLYRAIRHQYRVGAKAASARAKRRDNFLFVAVLTFTLTLLLAVGDEFHQSFVPSRTASARDVGIDMGGALIGLFIWRGIERRRRKGPVTN